MNYYISDLHLFCKSQTASGVNYDGRPYQTIDEMHQDILEKWNKKITNGDTVYILGDISIRGKNDNLIALIAQFKGRKILIRGNHDDISDYRYKQLFFEICDYKEVTDSFEGKSYKLVLCHYPILMWNGQHRGSILLYGHTHQTEEEKYFQQCITFLNENNAISHRGKQPACAINVGCMHPYMNYEPRSLKELLIARNVLE